MDLMAKFSCPGDLVAKFCAGTMAVTEACLLRFLGCDMDEVRVKKALSGLVKVYSRQELGFESDLMANEEICDVAGIFLSGMDGIHARRKKDVWIIPTRLLLMQQYIQHVIHFFIRTPRIFTD